MATMIDQFKFDGLPLPYERMTQRSVWLKKNQEYIAYRNALADTLRASYPSLIDFKEPSPADKKARAKWLKERKTYRYWLRVEIHLDRLRGDGDNYFKAVADALQTARIIHNDKHVTAGQFVVVEGKKPCIVLSLGRADQCSPCQ